MLTLELRGQGNAWQSSGEEDSIDWIYFEKYNHLGMILFEYRDISYWIVKLQKNRAKLLHGKSYRRHEIPQQRKHLFIHRDETNHLTNYTDLPTKRCLYKIFFLLITVESSKGWLSCAHIIFHGDASLSVIICFCLLYNSSPVRRQKMCNWRWCRWLQTAVLFCCLAVDIVGWEVQSVMRRIDRSWRYNVSRRTEIA